MKKIYGFLGAAALLMLASCSKDGAAADPDSSMGTGSGGGDFYMSVAVTPVGGIGTRTTTPGQGKEVGKDYENHVDKVLVILAKKEGTDYESLMVLEPALVGGDSHYTSTWEVKRDQVQTALANVSQLYVFVVANPTATMITQAKAPNNKIQDLFKLTEDETDEATYWTNNEFVMTNSELNEPIAITSSTFEKGTYSTPENPFELGEIKIQRVMSRMDIDVTKLAFESTDEKNQLGVTVTFDGVTLINQATSANLFKVTAANNTGYEAGKTVAFTSETASNYVLSPTQTYFKWALYDGSISSTTGALEGNQKAFTTFTYTDLASLAQESKKENSYNPNPSDYADNQGTYYIWRYCMENTNYYKDNQIHGNTTGVVFRAYLTDATSESPEQGLIAKAAAANAPIYAFNNVVYGQAIDLAAYVKTANNNDLVAMTVKGVLAKYNKTVDDVTGNEVFTRQIDTDLKDLGFTIYRPDGGKYYAYYIYWNRHNDNNDPTEMGAMEFATVRNNVYKLRVNSVKRLGHPADPSDDPDPDDPGDEDEPDQLYFNVVCQILPWEVRMNGIDF